MRSSLPEGLSLRFTETMRGHWARDPGLDHHAAAAQGARVGDVCEFTLTIEARDLKRFLEDANHEAEAVGDLRVPTLSAAPLKVTAGRFNLLGADPERVETRTMRYRLNAVSDAGERYLLVGRKTIRDDAGLDVWGDTTTLFADIHRGTDETAPLLGRGVLRILPADFLQQLRTIEVGGAANPIQRLEGMLAFGRFFAGTLFSVYGGIAAPLSAFDPDKPPRERRMLRAPAPEVHFCAASDGVQLRLTRYRGGPNGPVLLAHGLGVSSRIFSTDTIDTNLVEFLCAHGFDAWLLDYRTSIELASAGNAASGDEVATRDYPAAVDKVRAATGAPSIQVIAHCFGGTTFTMALLAGLAGVRSAVISQISTHVETGGVTRLKAGLHLPWLLNALGVRSLSAYVDTRTPWHERLFDQALRLQPLPWEERCTSATCHRITFMYAPLYEHDQLNALTHECLHELFGVANMRAFEHLATMVNARRVVAADGSDAYMPHLDRMAIPVTFIHGAENVCYLPQSTERTVEALAARNGAQLYRRHVIPDYGHIDCIFGKNAARDVYPRMLEHLQGFGA